MNIMKNYCIFLILVLSSLFLNSCKYDFVMPEVVPDIDQDEPVSFSSQVVPVFSDKCISCHDTQSPIMTANVAYSQLVPKYVNTANPASSKIYTVATSGDHYAKVSATQGALILQWITEGAKNN